MAYLKTTASGKSNVKVITKGDIFDDARRAGILNAAIAEGTAKLLPKVVQVIKDKLDKSLVPPEESGAFKRSITSRAYPSGTGVVKSTDKRKIKTWIETRRRGAERLGKGAYPFAAGKRFVNSEQKKGYYLPFIVKRLK